MGKKREKAHTLNEMDKGQRLKELGSSLFRVNEDKRLEWMNVVRKVMRGIYDAANHHERSSNPDGHQRACAKAAECV